MTLTVAFLTVAQFSQIKKHPFITYILPLVISILVYRLLTAVDSVLCRLSRKWDTVSGKRYCC